MTVRHERLTYRHWTGRVGRLPDPVRWMDLGVAPAPDGRWATLRHHWHHGRLMGFLRLSVAAFCVRSWFLPCWWLDGEVS